MAAGLLLLSAWLLLLPASASPASLLPGTPVHEDIYTLNYYWMTARLGLGSLPHQRLSLFPLTSDSFLTEGFPLDALGFGLLYAFLPFPVAYNAFLLFLLWALGMSHAWLAGGWWRRRVAAWGAGLAAQLAGVHLWDLREWRPTQVAAAIFLPLAVGAFLQALDGRRWAAVRAGLAVGLGALIYWYEAWFAVLALAPVLLLAAWEGRPWKRALAVSVGVSVLLVAPPMLHTLRGIGIQPGMELGWNDWVTTDTGKMPLVSMIEMVSYGGDVALGHSPLQLQPLALLLGLAVLPRAPRRRLLLPLLLLGLGVFAALGPVISLPGLRLPGLHALLLFLPVVRRFWWPYRQLAVAVVGGSLLVGGGLAVLVSCWRPALLLLPGLFLAARFGHPVLPLPSLEWRPWPEALQQAALGGPSLVLFPEKDPLLSVDQIFSGLPFVGPTPPVEGGIASIYEDFLGRGELAAVLRCTGRGDDRPPPGVRLAELGLRGVFLPRDILEQQGDSRRLRGCLDGLLGSPVEEGGPFILYPVRARKRFPARLRCGSGSGGRLLRLEVSPAAPVLLPRLHARCGDTVLEGELRDDGEGPDERAWDGIFTAELEGGGWGEVELSALDLGGRPRRLYQGPVVGSWRVEPGEDGAVAVPAAVEATRLAWELYGRLLLLVAGALLALSFGEGLRWFGERRCAR